MNSMNSMPWGFGTIIRLDPNARGFKPIPAGDPNRGLRWMILTPAAMGRPWQVVRLDTGNPGDVAIITSLVGYELADDE